MLSIKQYIGDGEATDGIVALAQLAAASVEDDLTSFQDDEWFQAQFLQEIRTGHYLMGDNKADCKQRATAISAGCVIPESDDGKEVEAAEGAKAKVKNALQVLLEWLFDYVGSQAPYKYGLGVANQRYLYRWSREKLELEVNEAKRWLDHRVTGRMVYRALQQSFRLRSENIVTDLLAQVFLGTPAGPRTAILFELQAWRTALFGQIHATYSSAADGDEPAAKRRRTEEAIKPNPEMKTLTGKPDSQTVQKLHLHFDAREHLLHHLTTSEQKLFVQGFQILDDFLCYSPVTTTINFNATTVRRGLVESEAGVGLENETDAKIKKRRKKMPPVDTSWSKIMTILITMIAMADYWWYGGNAAHHRDMMDWLYAFHIQRNIWKRDSDISRLRCREYVVQLLGSWRATWNRHRDPSASWYGTLLEIIKGQDYREIQVVLSDKARKGLIAEDRERNARYDDSLPYGRPRGRPRGRGRAGGRGRVRGRGRGGSETLPPWKQACHTKGLCINFNSRNGCAREQCRYKHHCVKCGDTSGQHGGADCGNQGRQPDSGGGDSNPQ